MTYQKIIKVLGLPDGSVRQSSAEKNKIFFVLYLTHPHSLRHTFTTRMCEAGVNIKVIQDALGHSDISTTLNIYADVTKEMKAAEFKGLDSYFKV